MNFLRRTILTNAVAVAVQDVKSIKDLHAKVTKIFAQCQPTVTFGGCVKAVSRALQAIPTHILRTRESK